MGRQRHTTDIFEEITIEEEDGAPTGVYFWRPVPHPHLAHPRLVARPVRMPRGSRSHTAQPTSRRPDFVDESTTTRLR